jgi:hypothetical protein
MVVEILIAQRDGNDPLCEHGTLVVDNEDRMAWVWDGVIEFVEESELVGDFSQQQRAAVAGEAAALKIGDDGLGAAAGKVEGIAVTVCHSGDLVLGRLWASLIHILPSVRSPHN